MPRAALARLRAKPPGERRIAIVLGNPSDTAPAAASLLGALHDAGYRVENAPADGAALTSRLQAETEEILSFATYSAVFATLPMPLQRHVSAQWGAAEHDPLFRPGRLDCGRFVVRALRCGNVAVLVSPAALDDVVPPHAYFAAYAWLGDEFRADAVIDLGGPGARSAEGLPEAVLGPVPRLVPPIVDGEVGRRLLEAIDRDEG